MTIERLAVRFAACLLVFAVSACGGSDDDDGAGTDADTDADSDADTDADSDADTDADSDADTDADSDADTDADADADTDASCTEWEFSAASYLHEIALRTSGGDDACCFDFTGDAIIDNTFGDFVDAMSGLVDMDPNAVIAGQIESGEMCRLIEYHGMTSATDDDGFTVPWLDCVDPDESFADNLSGEEEFLVSESSFAQIDEECVALPLSLFQDASVEGGHLAAAAEVVHGMSFPFMIEGRDLVFPLHDARLEADLTESASGVSAADGRLGGAIPHEAFWDYFNGFAAEDCACLGLDGPLFTWEVGPTGIDAECADLSGSTCDSLVDPEMCSTMTTMCGLLPPMLASMFDVDVDGDDIEDAMTVGLAFTAISAVATGVTYP